MILSSSSNLSKKLTKLFFSYFSFTKTPTNNSISSVLNTMPSSSFNYPSHKALSTSEFLNICATFEEKSQ